MTGFVKHITLAILLVCSISTGFAQKPKTVADKPAKFQKYTPPKLTSMLGIRSDSVSVAVEEARQLVALPLRVTDDKKNVYTISSYRVVYKRRVVTEDEKTGKAIPTTSTSINLFKSTPLSPIWIKTLTELMRIGEELNFFDIVVKDAQGRLMFAPDLKIKVK